MTNTQGTAIIRDRGQLTIPEKIRATLKWPASNTVVTITTITRNELIIKPYTEKSEPNWPDIWLKIELSRSFKGKRGNLAKFINDDRQKH
ncbi:hypothetical protein HY030_01460 [Candidatus Gottesmanbacteria bacterium]|nr:hypothetical protein [Candidatus Gottesmanbacteria bacterium]